MRPVNAAAALLLLLPAAGAAPVLSASPATLNTTTAAVTVTWSGVAGAQDTDWVSVYCVGAPESQFGAWEYVTACASWASGACSLPFTVSYSGCDIEFRMYRDPAPYTLLGTSNPVHWATGGNTTIRQVHVAFGEPAQSAMWVSWRTDSNATSVLQIGTRSGVYDLPNVTAAPAVTYLANDTCWENAGWRWPGYFHHAQATGLAAGTQYFARPVQGASVGDELSFRTGAVTGANVATQFITYADMGTSGGTGAAGTAQRVTARIAASAAGGRDFAFLAHIGDLSYGEGSVGVWDAWMDLIEPYARGTPYMVSLGNHEVDSVRGDSSKNPSHDANWHPSWFNGGEDSQGECGVPSDRRFRSPANGNGVFWYSFEAGNVHVAMVSSENDPSPGAPMGDWLIADLAAVDRSRTPWLLVGIHRPIYETEAYEGDYVVAQHLRQIMEPYLLQYRVNAVLAGHYHSFQRTCAVANLTCVSSAPGASGHGGASLSNRGAGGEWGIVHYTTGAAGASLDAINLYPSTYVDNTILGVYGYSAVVAPNASAMLLVFYANEDDSVRDQVWLYQ